MELLQIHMGILPAVVHPKEGSGGGGCQVAGISPLPIEILKNTDFIHMIISNILHDAPFSQTQSLKTVYV
jgi:hypothetical protein